ncbi:hypothetical protein VTO73DRAFT_15445 [Trametes versicolor]
MSVAAHYVAAAVPDARYANHYDPVPFFSYAQPSLNAVANDAQYTLGTGSSGAAYVWDAHEPAVQSPSSYSSASANAYHSAAAPPASSGHSSVTASFAYNAPPDYASHRSFSSNVSRAAPSHHPNASPPSSSSSAAATARGSSSSHRGSSYSSGARSYSSLAAAATTNASNASSSTPRLQNASWDNAALYTIDPADPVSHSPSQQHAYSRGSTTSSVPATPVSPPIKEEDPEGEFIIEVSVPADPVPSSMPEVPLRATHAPPKMRSMMCSFRLESFAMHDGIRSAATQPGPGGIVVGPLREQPIEFEWQADLVEPLIPQEEDAFRYGVAQGKARAQVGYSAVQSSPSPRKTGGNEGMMRSPRTGRTRADSYTAAGTASPALSLDYPQQVDSGDAWDASSGYGSVADNGSGSVATSASPTFAPIMTPAQSLGWSLRYQSGDVDGTVEPSSGYHRQQTVTQPSLSRVSQPASRYGVYASSSSVAKTYQPEQQAHYGYDSSGYPRSSASSAGRYSSSEVYASSGSSSSWYR